MKELEWLWPYPREIKVSGQFPVPSSLSVEGDTIPDYLMADIARVGQIPATRDVGDYLLKLESDNPDINPEGYHLSLGPSSGCLSAADKAGLSYGVQTLLQILALCHDGQWPQLEITDWPAYRKRCFMVDLGRSVFNLPILKRIVRILNRLKMNQLHIHLYDDELCGVRFDGLPFGQENPYALSMGELAELIRYAEAYQVEIVPELEGWGHVGSLVYHRKSLRGGKGMYNGSSFLICEESLSLMKEIITKVAETMPNGGTIHLGLDEAKWVLGPNMPQEFSPTHLVERYYNILQDIGEEQGKTFTMRLWADHAGRPVPEKIQHNVIIEPWQYWNANLASIDRAVGRYTANKEMRWMGGAGVSGAQHRGAFHATRYWAKQALESENADGINITFWCWNDIGQKFFSLFAGAYYIWNPHPPSVFADFEEYENFDRFVFPIMYWWQSTFRDAFPDDIQTDSGPLVYMGYYMWGPKHGQPVAPTAPTADSLSGHDFLNE